MVNQKALAKYREACEEMQTLNPSIRKLKKHDFMAIDLFNTACSYDDPEDQVAGFQHVIDFCIDVRLERYDN